MPVTYVVKQGKAIFQGDIILEKVEPLPFVGVDSFGIDYTQYLWPQVGNQYQIPYVITSGTGDLTNLNTAIAQCDATVGRVGGQQQVGGAGGSVNACAAGTILHEMGHTLGLWHEQSRADRNTYISVNYGNLIKGSISNFSQLYDNAQQTTLFDYASIMEYPAFSFSRNGGPATESVPAGIPLSNLAGYTAGDIDGIERLYGNPPAAVTVTSNPPGLQVIVDGSTVTTPQVFSNWALNSTHTLDIPAGVQSQSGFIVNSTQPTTFYYTYSRWNDSTAASHSITILPGNGNPSTPATSLCGNDLLGELHPAGSLRRHGFSLGHGNHHTLAGAPELSRVRARLLHRPPASHTHRYSECGAKLLRIQQRTFLASRRSRRQSQDFLCSRHRPHCEHYR